STSDITVSSPGTYTLVVSDSNGCQSLGYPFLVDEIRVPIAITNPDLGFCEGDSLLLTANSGMAHYLWTPSGDTTRTTQIIETGVISLSVVDTNGCMANLGPVEVTQSNSLIQFSSTGNSIICAGDTVVLTANNPNFTSYNWMPGNINSNSITVSQSGNYWMSATDSVGCVSNSDTAQVVVVENDLNAPIIAVDSLVCEGARVLIIGDAGSDTIYWYTNFGGSPIYVGDTLVRTINGSTTFFAQTVSVPCASEFVAVDLYTDDCDKVTPSNVFTPNGDGVNDQWSLAILGATCYEVEIYNRWGILISTLTASGAYWDGTIDQSSLDAADGTYYFILKYCDYKNERFSQTGYITLIR
ncbi:MAG: gliding motility-associated-like protein, partial [Halieaceae bacterium]